MGDFEAKDDPGVSPSQVRVDYITVNRDLLKGTLEVLFRRAPPTCEVCGKVALFCKLPLSMGAAPTRAHICGLHATNEEKYCAIAGADHYLVALQLLKECS